MNTKKQLYAVVVVNPAGNLSVSSRGWLTRLGAALGQEPYTGLQLQLKVLAYYRGVRLADLQPAEEEARGMKLREVAAPNVTAMKQSQAILVKAINARLDFLYDDEVRNCKVLEKDIQDCFDLKSWEAANCLNSWLRRRAEAGEL